MTVGQVFNLECQVKLGKSLAYEKRKKGLLFTVNWAKSPAYEFPDILLAILSKI